MTITYPVSVNLSPLPIEPTPLREANADVITYSPSGDVIAMGDDDGTLYILDAASGEIVHRVEEVFENVRNAFTSLVYSPDGELIAVAGCIQVDRFCELYDVRLIDASTGDIRVTLNQPTDPILSLAFSPDGTLLATGSGTPLIWDGYEHPSAGFTSEPRIRLWGIPATNP